MAIRNVTIVRSSYYLILHQYLLEDIKTMTTFKHLQAFVRRNPKGAMFTHEL
jgi:hypothetical protein